MDFNKTSKLLKKFKGLHNTLRDSGQEPSSIEKDLLMSYLKELYEQVLSIGDAVVSPVQGKTLSETITASSNGNGQSYEAPQPIVAAAPIAASAPAVQRIVREAPVQAAPPAAAPPPPAPVRSTPVSTPTSSSGPLDDLFREKSSNELSDRLNKLPITDINRAMGINEKVLTINELFNGDQELFSKTMLKLNSLNSFEEAKNYLIAGVASDFNWAEEAKMKKADKFVVLLRRRYS